MDKQLFRATETKLYDYFQADKKISCLNLKIGLLKKHIRDMEQRVKETDITIPDGIQGATYGDIIQNTGNVTSYAEKTAIRIIDEIENEIAYKKEHILLIEKDIRSIETDNATIGYNLRFLSKNDKRFLELKYKDEKRDWQIGVEMNISQSTATRTRQRLVEDVARWNNLLNLKNVH